MVFISKEKLHVSAYSGHLQNLKMAAIGRNMYFFLTNEHNHLAIFYSCVFWLNSPHHIAFFIVCVPTRLIR